VGQSATHQISHTKGFVADGRVGGEGSTTGRLGEGTFVETGQPGGPGYKAQNKRQSIFTTPTPSAVFKAELIAEHRTAQQQPATPRPGRGDNSRAQAPAEVHGEKIAARKRILSRPA